MDYADGRLHALTMGNTELRTILDAAAQLQQLVVVDFSASWCGPCKAMVPVLEEMAREQRGRVVFCKVDCEAPGNRQLAQEAAIAAFPTFHIYRARQRVVEFRGANRTLLQQSVQQQLAQLAQHPAAEVGGAAAAVGPPGPMTTALAQALGQLRSSCSYEEFLSAARTLLAYLSNVLSNPGDPKYRRVRLSNATFQAKLGSKPGGKEGMAAVGFKERQEEGEAVLVMDSIAGELHQVKTFLERAFPGTPARGGPAPLAAATVGPQGTLPVQPPPAAGGGGAGGAPAGADVDAAALARTLAAAMGSGGAAGYPGAAAQGGRGGWGAGPAGGRGPAGRPPHTARVSVSVPRLARLLEKILVDGGFGAPQQPPS